MATIELRLSSKIQKDTHRSEVLIRLFQGSKLNLRSKTGISISPTHFEYYIDREKTHKAGVKVPTKAITATMEEAIKNKYIIFERGDLFVRNRIESEDKIYHDKAKARLDELKQFILTSYENTDKSTVTSEWLKTLIDKFHHPEKYKSKEERTKRQSFFDTMEEYLKDTKYSEVREKNFRVLIRALKRYEMFIRLSDKVQKDFILDIDTIDKERILDIESFLRNEHCLLGEYPNIFQKIPATTDTNRKSPKPQPRGNNTICALFNKLRAFFNWCNVQGKTNNRPFAGYNGVTTEKYGTPYYITLEERNLIADFDLSAHPSLEVQRDIFIFQCCIGCRISDLMRLTDANIIDEEVNYIPRKTKDSDPITVKVPLNDRALRLVEKYAGIDKNGKLFPFIASQNYNEDIKKIFKICGITRLVTVLNPTTGEEEQKPINEVASSHMARRTFVGNLYKKIKDPNIICPMSGHKIGSTAFARYREVDKEMRKEAVKLID